MDCPACGRDNAADRMECAYCQALLVDAFEPDADSKTDPIQIIGGSQASSADTDALLRAAREMSDDDPPPRESLERLPTHVNYTGDLPRLFRFGNRYQILEKLGEGGMGRVYKALDLELDRAVALKTIRTEKGSSREVLERFKQELILARKVTHKNVIRIYDLGESEGMKFFTMELVEGESLRDVLKDKPGIPVEETLSYMKQMLSGLSEAHRQGVVHRDLKPQNIMVDGEGTVRIMDFGIARTADSATMTGTGEMMGTPDYISPEQVRGETANAQSDLYSFGVILYELLTGETPFKGDTPIAKIVARIQTKPRPPRELNQELPTHLERIVLKCLEADPDLRYHTAEEVLEDLEREQVDSSLWLRIKKSLSRNRGWVAAACLAGATAVGAWYYRNLPDPLVAADVPVTTIAVLPFHNVLGAEDLDWMENGIPEMLITDISQLRSLRPVMAERMSHILRQIGKQDQSRFDDEAIVVVAQMSGADHALYGRFVQAEGRLRFSLTLRDSETGLVTPLNVEAEPDKIFGLVDDLTERVADALNVEEDTLPIGSISTSSLEAFRAYHRGMAELRNGANRAAIPYFEQAIELDSKYAMAHAQLASALFSVGSTELATQYSEIADNLTQPEALPLIERFQIHAISARIADDPERAVQSYRKLSEFYPDDPDVLSGLADSLAKLGEFDEAIETYERVLDVAPDYGAALLGLATNLEYSGRGNEAIPLLDKALEVRQFANDREGLAQVHTILGNALRKTRNYDKAVAHYDQALSYQRELEDHRGIAGTLIRLAGVSQELGHLEDATRQLDDAIAIARERTLTVTESFALQNLGNLALESGELEMAFQHYRDSLEIEWERGEHDEIAFRLDAIAEVYRLGARYTEAMVYLDQAKHHLEVADDPIETAYNVSVRGHIKKARGQYNEAIQDFLTALPVLASSDYTRDTSLARQALTSIYLEQGRFSEALAVVEQALADEETLNGAVVAVARIQRGGTLLRLGATQEARAELDAARELVVDAVSFEGRPQLDLVWGQWLRAGGDYRASEETLRRALRDAERQNRIEDVQRVTIELAGLRLDNGRLEASHTMFRDVRAAAHKLGHNAVEAVACLGLAATAMRTDDLEEAKRAAMDAKQLASTFGGGPITAHANLYLSEIARQRGNENERNSFLMDGRAELSWMVDEVPEKYRDTFRSLEPWSLLLSEQ